MRVSRLQVDVDNSPRRRAPFRGGREVPGRTIADSGAAENVMPREDLPGLPVLEKQPGVRFVAANGGEIGNYGRKDVLFKPASSFPRPA